MRADRIHLGQQISLTRLGRPYQLLMFTGVLIVAWTFLFPALNWPDEIYKLERILVDQSIYARLFAFWQPDQCDIQVTQASTASYLSNELRIRATGDLGCYYVYKTANVALFLALMGTAYYLLSDRQTQRIFLLSLIWPPVLFYASSINQQTVFVVASSYMVTATLTSKRIWPFIVLSIAFIVFDRSFISTSLFLSALSFLRWKPRAAVPMVLIASIGAVILSPLMMNYSIGLNHDMSFGDLGRSLAAFEDPVYVSLGLLFVSFVYLGGTNVLLGVGFDYLFVFVFVVVAIWKKRANSEMWAYAAAFFFTYFLLLSVVPTLQTFRYYTFLMPALIYFLLDTTKLRRSYSVYSLGASFIYLFMANVAHY
jgi:hypothetical protein